MPRSGAREGAPPKPSTPPKAKSPGPSPTLRFHMNPVRFCTGQIVSLKVTGFKLSNNKLNIIFRLARTGNQGVILSPTQRADFMDSLIREEEVHGIL